MRIIDQFGLGPTYEEEQLAEGWRVTVIPRWANSGNGASIVLTEDQFKRYKTWRHNRASCLIQHMLPELSPSQREILVSGLDDKTFHSFIGGDDED